MLFNGFFLFFFVFWTVDSGQCIVDSGQWIVDSGQWTVDSGQLTVIVSLRDE